MTKVTILGQSEPKQKELKPIEFKMKLSDTTTSLKEAILKPNRWDNIELIAFKYNGVYDLMYAYDDNRNEGLLYLGHFNDGVV
jgi:hypothetical protein